MAQRIEGKMFPPQIFIAGEDVVTPDGKSVKIIGSYDKDPLKMPDRSANRYRLEEMLFRFFGGTPSVANPLIIQVKGVLIDRCEDFTPGAAVEVLEGRMNGHFEDLSGREVKIMAERSKNPDYPFVGLSYDDEESQFPTAWGYDNDGNCNDGNSMHRIVIMKEATAKETPAAEDKKDPVEGAEE